MIERGSTGPNCVIRSDAANTSSSHSASPIIAASALSSPRGSFQLTLFIAWYLCVAHRVLGDQKYADQAAGYRDQHRNRADFYHLTRGVAVELYDPVAQGDDYRNMFWSEGHITWLSTYWYLQLYAG